MQAIGAFEAKTHFSALLERVEKGEQIIITKHGHPVAKLIPTTQVHEAQVREAIKELKKFSKRHSLGGLDWKTLRDEGKR
jgi:prevent-host-death family protein